MSENQPEHGRVRLVLEHLQSGRKRFSAYSKAQSSDRRVKRILMLLHRHNRAKSTLVLLLSCPLIAPAISHGQIEQKTGSEQNTNQRKGASESIGRGKGGSGLGNYTEPPPVNNVPDHLFNIILGRPSDHGVCIRVLFHREATAYLTYGSESGNLSARLPSFKFKAKEVHDFVLGKRQPNRRYFYKLVYQSESGTEQSSDEYSFQTRRCG